MRLLLPALIVLLSLPMLARPAGAEEALSITRDQYQLYKDYQGALQDPRVEKMKESQRVPAIARNFHVKEKELRAAIAAGEKDASRVEAAEVAALKVAFKGTPLEGHLGEIRVDAHEGHIVAYVQWFNADVSKLDQEACWVAARGVLAAPLVGTFNLYADAAGQKDKKVFSALIGHDRAVNIREASIVDYAQTRYRGLFEKRETFAAQP